MKKYRTALKEKNQHKIIAVTCIDVDNKLEDLINYIGKIGNPGHSFTIDVDPGSDTNKKFGWDGDGSDRIIKVSIAYEKENNK